MSSDTPRKSIGDIAIIGMAGRFPGARDLAAFWENLRNGVESVTFFGDDELLAAGVDPGLLANPLYVKARPIIEGVEMFDAEFFGIAPREAALMDPQHRLFLTTAWRALEDAGYDPERYEGAIGVYGGMGLNSYLLSSLCADRAAVESILASRTPGDYLAYLGNEKDYLATRVAFKLNLKGPALTLQTACSTSLVAVCHACQSLLYYQCDMALAGGITVFLPQQKGYLAVEGGMHSPDGHCRTFDARAQGTTFGNGVGLVLLKRLADALADGDNIYAVIKGSALNNDGSLKVSYTAPSMDGQAEVIALAQMLAGVTADTISYVEAHGTGTPLGDPIEIAGLTQAFRESTDKTGYCGIGSVKTNIGHLDVAAGIAGLIKTALALRHELIPPSLNFEQPNPQIDFARSPFYVVTKPTAWPRGPVPRRAGVSAFGVGGTNAHAVLEEAPALAPSGPSRAQQLLLLSARTPAALDATTAQLAAHLEAGNSSFADTAYTLHAGRRAFQQRRVLVAPDAGVAAALLRKPDPKRVFTGAPARLDPPVVLMFPGQGAQQPNMGKELRAEPVFRDAFDCCGEQLRGRLGLDLGEALSNPDLINETRLTQPALFAFEYALAKLWLSWGVHPAAMIGHSVGEYVAACLAGVFTLDDALMLVAERAALVQQHPRGAMTAVRLPETELLPLLGDGLSIAAVNAPSLCVVSGPFEAVEEFERRLKEHGKASVRLHTSHAFHSKMMDPVVAPFTELLRRVKLSPPQLPYISNVTGQWVTAAQATDPAYWANHVRQAVRFADGIAQLLAEPTHVFLEVGPNTTLGGLTRQHPARQHSQPVISSVNGGNELELVLTAAGRLWIAGVNLEVKTFFANQTRRRVPLPTYPFQEQRCWVDPPAHVAAGRSDLPVATGVSRMNLPATTTTARPTDSPVGAELKAILRQISGRNFADADFAASFVELGFESLSLTQVSLALANRFGVKIPFRDLLGELGTLDALANRLDGASLTPARQPVAIPAVPPPTSAPLTEAQREIWLATALGPAASCAFNQSRYFRLRGPLQPVALESALRELVRRHDGLRATFAPAGEEQRVLADLPVSLPVTETTEAELPVLLEAEAGTPFDLEHGPLWRARLLKVGPQDHALLFTVQHIVADGRAVEVIESELGQLYTHYCRQPHTPPSLPVPESLMAHAHAMQTRSPDYDKAQEYWLKVFGTEPPSLDLPADFVRPGQKSYRGGVISLKVPAGLAAELRRTGARQNCTLSSLLSAVFFALLHRLTGQQDIVVGVPTLTPGVEADSSLVGHTVNFLAIRGQIDGDAPWRTHLENVRQLTLAAFEHRSFTYGSLLERLHFARDASRLPLVAASFNYARNRREIAYEKLTVECANNPHAYTNLDLVFDFTDAGDELSLDCQFNADVLSRATVSRWARHFLTLAEAAIQCADEPIGALPMLSESERRQLLVEWNDTARPYLAQSVAEQFAAQVRRHPDAVAVAFEGRTLSYRELDEQAESVAARLREQGVGPEKLVGINVERSVEMIVGLVAVAKTGGAYLPLDPMFPAERLAFMVEEAKPVVVLTRESVAEMMAPLPNPLPQTAGERGPELLPLPCRVGERPAPLSFAGTGEGKRAWQPDGLAYVLYTSGSTGKPKGVQITQRALVNFLAAMRREPGLTAADRLVAVTTLSFDIAGLEIWLPLTTGARIVLASRETAADGKALANLLAESGATMLQATPATWRLLLAAGWEGSRQLKALCGGEALPADLAAELLPRCAELWNMYGPTETTIWSSVCRVEPGQPIRVGGPIANTTFYVVDSRQQPVPVGVPGELWIGGDGVARGYLNRPGLTAEKFIADPFSAKPGARLYRTGDLVRYTASGKLEFLGRLDHQVKVRGFRIELGEIESVLRAHAAVRQAVVMAREDAPGDNRLVGYIVAQNGEAPAGALREFLRSKLPDYMVPADFVMLPAMPLTPNGKVDRRALPAPARERAQSNGALVAPRDALEIQLARCWENVFNRRPLGIHDNFFELGGHSLLAVRMFAQVEKLTGRRLPLATLFQAPTIAQLAAVLKHDGWEAPWHCLVPIKPNGSRPPFYCVHGIGGNIIEYLDLAKYMDDDQPFYGIQAIGLDGKQPRLNLTVEEMARRYLEEVRAFQPQGPYYFGGSSFGGSVAYEMAQQLAAAGEQVGLLAFFDTNGPGYPQFLPTTTVWQKWWDELSHRTSLHWENLMVARGRERLNYLGTKAAKWGRGFVAGQRQQLRRRWRRLRDWADELLLPSNIRRVRRAGHWAAYDYRPRPYAGHVTLFRATQQPRHIVEDRTLGWGGLVQGGITVVDTPGHHGAIVRDPRARGLAMQLQEALRHAQQEPAAGKATDLAAA